MTCTSPTDTYIDATSIAATAASVQNIVLEITSMNAIYPIAFITNTVTMKTVSVTIVYINDDRGTQLKRTYVNSGQSSCYVN